MDISPRSGSGMGGGTFEGIPTHKTTQRDEVGWRGGRRQKTYSPHHHNHHSLGTHSPQNESPRMILPSSQIPVKKARINGGARNVWRVSHGWMEVGKRSGDGYMFFSGGKGAMMFVASFCFTYAGWTLAPLFLKPVNDDSRCGA